MYLILPADGKVTPLGLTNKYISCAAITSIQQDENRTLVVLKEGGIFSFVAESEPEKVLVNGILLEITINNKVYSVDCSHIKDTVCVEIL